MKSTSSPFPRSEPKASGERQSSMPDLDFAPLRSFWEGAAAGELRIPRCTACGTWIWYPRATCPACKSADVAWTATSGRGTLYSFAVVRRALWEPYAPFVPYATGLVALAEDPAVRIVTRFVDCDLDALRIDAPVRAVFRPLSFEGDARSCAAPFFTPSDDCAHSPTRDSP
jgi:uncharacterized OB-fold protein